MEYSTLNLLALDADIAAKAGLDVTITSMRFSVSDLLTCVNQLCVKEWQELWNQCTSNKQYVKIVILRSQLSTFTFTVTVQQVRDILEWTLSKTFLKMLHLATSSLMLKISTFAIVYNVVFTLA